MPNNKSSYITQSLTDGLSLNEAVELVPNKVNDNIDPVFVTNNPMATPVTTIVHGAGTAQGNTDLTFGSVTGKGRRYITGIYVDLEYNTGSEILIQVLIRGSYKWVCKLTQDTTNGSAEHVYLPFSYPLLVDNVSNNVRMNCGIADGDHFVSVHGFEVQ